MKVIRTEPHEKYDCDQVVEIFSPQFCAAVGWTAERIFTPQSEGEKGFALADDAEVEIGWRVRGGLPLPPEAEVLDDLKRDKWEEIGEAYDAYDRRAAVTTGLGFPLQIGQAHVTKLDGAIRLAQAVGRGEIYITDAADVTHEGVAVADAMAALVEVMGAAMAAHHRKQELRARIRGAADAEELRGIGWDL